MKLDSVTVQNQAHQPLPVRDFTKFLIPAKNTNAGSQASNVPEGSITNTGPQFDVQVSMAGSNIVNLKEPAIYAGTTKAGVGFQYSQALEKASVAAKFTVEAGQTGGIMTNDVSIKSLKFGARPNMGYPNDSQTASFIDANIELEATKALSSATSFGPRVQAGIAQFQSREAGNTDTDLMRNVRSYANVGVVGKFEDKNVKFEAFPFVGASVQSSNLETRNLPLSQYSKSPVLTAGLQISGSVPVLITASSKVSLNASATNTVSLGYIQKSATESRGAAAPDLTNVVYEAGVEYRRGNVIAGLNVTNGRNNPFQDGSVIVGGALKFNF